MYSLEHSRERDFCRTHRLGGVVRNVASHQKAVALEAQLQFSCQTQIQERTKHVTLDRRIAFVIDGSGVQDTFGRAERVFDQHLPPGCYAGKKS